MRHLGKRKYLNIIAALIILTEIGFRFLPHPPNFTPIASVALLGGFFLSLRTALILPLVAIAISDLFLGTYHLPVMVAVYVSFLTTVFLGFILKKHKKNLLLLVGSFFSSILFFVVTNFSVWAFTSLYEKTFPGLIRCYIMAVPFFKNTLLSNLFYTGAFLALYAFASSWKKIKLFNHEFVRIGEKG